MTPPRSIGMLSLLAAGAHLQGPPLTSASLYSKRGSLFVPRELPPSPVPAQPAPELSRQQRRYLLRQAEKAFRKGEGRR